MFNPSNFHEVCVQVIHMESKGNNVNDSLSAESSQLKEGKDKGKVNRTVIVNKGDVKFSCSHCQRDGNDKDQCWKLHPKLKTKWAKQ